MGFIPIHPEGWRFAAIFAGITSVFFLISPVLGYLGMVLTAWCVYFFRNPQRVVPQNEDLILSPADGIVQNIVLAPLPKELGDSGEMRTRISIFLNVFDVHVNRTPAPGIIQKIFYHKGLFFNASLDKASEHNERQTVVMTTTKGHELIFVQIAGLIARRIRCDITEGQSVDAGQLYGLIRFGSRADVYLPKNVVPLVAIGQRMLGGETILANCANSNEQQEAPYEFVVR